MKVQTQHYNSDLVSVLGKLVENAPDPIVTVDDKHHIVMFNHAAASVFGYEFNDAIGQHLAMLFPDDECIKGAHDPAELTKSGHLNLTGRKKTGEKFPCDVSLAQAEHNGKKYCTAMIRDVSDQEDLHQYRKTKKAQLLSEVRQVKALN